MSVDLLFQESVEKAQKELTKQKEVIALHDNAIKDKSAEMVKYREQNNELQLKVKELEHSITKCQQEAADADAKVFWNCAFLHIVTKDGYSLATYKGNMKAFFL